MLQRALSRPNEALKDKLELLEENEEMRAIELRLTVLKVVG